MSPSRCSSSEVSTQQTLKPSNSHVSQGRSSSSSSSSSSVLTPRRGEGRVDCHEISSASTVSGNTESTVNEAASVDRVSESKPLEKEACSDISTDQQNDLPAQFDSVAYTSTNKSPASEIPWPMWTVSHMMALSSLEKVISHYRALKLADHLNDRDLRCFLEEQLCKERAGLSDITISDRLRKREMITVGENPETCSICMVEFKDQDTVASLYYCSHEYHADCIKEWLLKYNLCPMCRALAIIPESYPCWEADVKLHQAYFVHLQHSVS